MDEDDNCQVSKPDAISRAKAAFDTVFANGAKIELDHHLVYHARTFMVILYKSLYLYSNLIDYELGRLLSREGDNEAARKQFDLVLSGKPLEVNASGKKGKYSMEVSRVAVIVSLVDLTHSYSKRSKCAHTPPSTHLDVTDLSSSFIDKYAASNLMLNLLLCYLCYYLVDSSSYDCDVTLYCLFPNVCHRIEICLLCNITA